MYRIFRDEKQNGNVEKEIIKIYDLKFENKKGIFRNKEKELDNKMEDLSKIQYYKIEDKKREELEKVFKQIKANIKLSFNLEKSFKRDKQTIIPEILYDIKIEKNNIFALFMMENISLK